MYAILDIETTGGKYNEEGITEIAIYRFDGRKIIDQFSSLINPEIPIQPFVVNLTGINNDMLRSAPKFFEVAKRIIEITEDCIIVAHNALFDNRILSTEFDRLGYNFEKTTLCTVELAKKLIPNLPSYSLGKLVRSLGIPLSDRHRAQGDAKATLSLFKILLAKDTHKEIISQTVITGTKPKIGIKLWNFIESTPTSTGVFYLYNKEGNILFIGKSKNIQRKLRQLFTGENKLSQNIKSAINSISFEETGSELIAQLKEIEEIKVNRPTLSRAVKIEIFSHQLEAFSDKNGYINLKIEKANNQNTPIATFVNYSQGKAFLNNYIEKYELCKNLTDLETIKNKRSTCFFYEAQSCKGACLGNETTAEYNTRVTNLIDQISIKNRNLLLIDRGRDIDERSVILIENGEFKGFGYYNLNHQLKNIERVRAIITPMENSPNNIHLIQSYLRKNKQVKMEEISVETLI